MRTRQRPTADVASSRALGGTYAASLGVVVVVLAAVAWLALQVMAPLVPPGAAAKRMVTVRGGAIAVPGLDGPVNVRVRTLEVDPAEVSVERYRACVAAGKCATPGKAWGPGADGDGACNHEHAERAGWPMNCVSVKEAIDYCQWWDARLPTSSEWRYLAEGAAGAEAGLRDVAGGLDEWACDVAPEAEEVDDVVCWTFAKMGAGAAAESEEPGAAPRAPRYYWRDGHRSATTGFRCVR
jgi:formylglycine-generating enzyme required for sulfatase activity